MTRPHTSVDLADMPGDLANARFRDAAARGVRVGLLMHVLFIVEFLALGIHTLALLSIGSIAIYAVILVLLNARHEKLATSLVWIEILGHAALSCRLVGFDSGFQYYPGILVLLIYLGTPHRPHMQFAMASALMVLVTLGDIAFHGMAPLIALPQSALDTLRRVNVVAFLGALAFLALFYAQSVNRVQRDLHALATTDMLTGLTNRRQLVEIAEYELARSMRSAEPLAAIIVDVDRFKEVNDVHGHVSGDDVLTEVARRLMSAVRAQDTVARWGGEEFLVLLPNTDLHAAAATAERIRLAVADRPVETGHALVNVTITSGVSQWQNGERMETCIARADRALYRGKAAGRNRTELAMDSRPVMDTPLELDLRQSA